MDGTWIRDDTRREDLEGVGDSRRFWAKSGGEVRPGGPGGVAVVGRTTSERTDGSALCRRRRDCRFRRVRPRTSRTQSGEGNLVSGALVAGTETYGGTEGRLGRCVRLSDLVY